MSWFDEPMRWMQINLVEDDPRSADVGRWKQIWENGRVEGLTISAGGAVAFYPTDLPFQQRSSFLGQGDLFGDLVAAAKALDIRVLARFECLFLDESVYEAHPDWFRTSASAMPQTMRDLTAAMLRDVPGVTEALKRYRVSEGHYMPCWHGPFYREMIPLAMTELAQRYEIDGFFANAWPQPGAGTYPANVAMACHCPHCLAQWEDCSGGEPYPTADDPDDELWRRYMDFVSSGAEVVHRKWQEHAKSLRPDLSFVACTTGSISSGLRWSRFGPMDLVANDCQGRGLVGAKGEGTSTAGVWMAGRSAKIMRAVAGERPLFQIVGAWQCGGPSRPALRRSAMPGQELTTMLAQATANGLRPWANVAGGTIYDDRWIAPLTAYYSWHASIDEHLRGARSLARVAVVWSPESGAPYTRPAERPSMVDAVNGWYLALLTARIPFEIVSRELVTEDDLARFDVVVVPSGTILDERTTGLIEQCAERSGVVIGCGVSTPRAWARDVMSTSDVDGPYPPGYLAIDGMDHPLVAAIGDPDYLPAGTWRSRPKVAAGNSVGRPAPTLPFLADKAFFPDDWDAAPVLCVDDRTVVLGSDLDALHGVTQLPDPGSVLVNAVTVAAKDRNPSAISVEGSGMFEVTAWQTDRALVVHLVNLTSPDLYGGPLTWVAELGPLRVRIDLPNGRAVTGAVLLSDGREAGLSRTAGCVHVEVPSLHSYEVILVETTDEAVDS
ncbi:alpha-amylase family protein [Saccharomonospora sp. NPDC046836]|uniref:alpha-amylase family protein n=1 Tax=Saccharomonospora sp. NPDC046836 TaxID=3156921 RepID=UPI0033C2A3B3